MCGKEFHPARKNQFYCSRECQKNATRAASRAHNREAGYHPPTRFIGVDGEGWTDELGEHRYGMLSIGDRSIVQLEHLGYDQIFSFLWEAYQDDKRAAFVGFYLGYDFSQWLRTLPAEQGAQLLGRDGIAARRRSRRGRGSLPSPVSWDGWEFDILGMKRFKLRAEGARDWMYINDCGPFFQTSFMNVLDPKKWPDGSPVDLETYETIKQGKAKRADYDTAAKWQAGEAELIAYNVAENRALAQVMHHYEDGLRTAGVHLDRDQWYGPGQAAQAWMKNIGVGKREDMEDVIPHEVFDFARRSYYGGRFEVFAHGHVPGASYEYDINSAYPAAMTVMPDWRECEFEWVTGISWSGLTAQLALLDVTTSGEDRVAGGLPHREKSGRIHYPWKTRGVRWSFEVLAAMSAGLVDSVEVHQALIITPSAGSVLNQEIPRIYQQRLDVGKESSSGKALKLIYNSAYGKQAQSIGSPMYSNPLSASFITSHCRTQILNAIATHPSRSESLLMIATDGVYFRSPHPFLDLSESELGKWSSQTKNNLTIVMPGVYFDDRGRKIGAAALKTRGIPGEAFANALAALDAGFDELTVDPSRSELWPVMTIPIKFQVKTPKSALNEGQWGRAGTVTRDKERKISSDPSTKRQGAESPQLLMFGSTDYLPYLADGIVRTYPYDQGAQLESHPYVKTFGIDDESGAIDMDGPVQHYIVEAMMGADE